MGYYPTTESNNDPQNKSKQNGCIFTNECPIQSANEQNHVHQTKMIVDYVHLLSTAHRLLDGDNCKVWVKRASITKHEDGTRIKKVGCMEIDWHELPSDTFVFRFGRRWLMGNKMYAHTHTQTTLVQCGFINPTIIMFRDGSVQSNYVCGIQNEPITHIKLR